MADDLFEPKREILNRRRRQVDRADGVKTIAPVGTIERQRVCGRAERYRAEPRVDRRRTTPWLIVMLAQPWAGPFHRGQCKYVERLYFVRDRDTEMPVDAVFDESIDRGPALGASQAKARVVPFRIVKTGRKIYLPGVGAIRPRQKFFHRETLSLDASRSAHDLRPFAGSSTTR